MRIEVCADPLGQLRRQHRAAYGDLAVRDLPAQQRNGALHGGDCGGHQRGKTYHMHLLLLHRGKNTRRRDVLAQVQHLKAVGFQHDADNIFADVVNIALHCSQHDTSLLMYGLSPRCQRRLDRQESTLRGVRAHQQLRQV